MVMSFLLHAASNWLGLTVLHHGGLYYCRHRRVAAAVEETQGDFYSYRLFPKLLGWINLHNTSTSYFIYLFTE